MRESWTEWVEDPSLVDFYASHRRRPEDLYPSERRFLPWLLRRSSSVLDTGCALGGFADIHRHYNPAIEYCGIDVSQPLVDAANRMRPDLDIRVGDTPAGLDVERFDLVQGLGWLHWDPRY